MLANLKCSSCLCWKLWKLKSASWFHIIPGDDSLEYLLSAEGYEIILYTGRIANYLIRMSTTLANRPVLCDLLRVFGFDYFTCSQCLFTFTSISEVVPCFRGRLRIGFGARYFCRGFFLFCFLSCTQGQNVPQNMLCLLSAEWIHAKKPKKQTTAEKFFSAAGKSGFAEVFKN